MILDFFRLFSDLSLTNPLRWCRFSYGKTINERNEMPTYTVNFEGYTIVVAPDEEIAKDKVEEQLMSVTSDLWITAVEE